MEAETERSYIGNLERDTRGPSVRALARLGEALGVSSTHTENGSNIRPSNIGACNTAISPLNIIPDEAHAWPNRATLSAEISDDGHANQLQM